MVRETLKSTLRDDAAIVFALDGSIHACMPVMDDDDIVPEHIALAYYD